MSYHQIDSARLGHLGGAGRVRFTSHDQYNIFEREPSLLLWNRHGAQDMSCMCGLTLKYTLRKPRHR
jgi:hypothetical protein